MSSFTIGADPEFFLESKKTGKLVPSQSRVEGTKDEPKLLKSKILGVVPSASYGVDAKYTKYYVQRDNVAAEYCIPPAVSSMGFASRIEDGINLAFGSIPFAKRKNLAISKKSSGIFEERHLNNEEALNFGCDPDYNAWTATQNVIDKSGVNPGFRTAGGHIHVGYRALTPGQNPLALVRAMDLYLGVVSVLYDTDNERRKLYGKAGAYRPTKYGIEYRVLSNFWIFNPEYTRWVFSATNEAFNYALSHPMIEPDSVLGNNIQLAINNSDKELAHDLIALYLLPQPIDTLTRRKLTSKLNDLVTWASTDNPISATTTWTLTS